MKHIGFLALLLGASMTVSAAVVPQAVSPKTPIVVVDTSGKEIIVDVPDTINYAKEVKDPSLDNLRQYTGMDDAKYVRNIAKALRDNPAAMMKQVFNVDVSAIDMQAYEGKKALGTNKDPVGVTMEDTKTLEDVNWVDSLADVRMPEFLGDYNDLKELQGEFQEQREKGLEEIKKLDLKQKLRLAPVRQAI